MGLCIEVWSSPSLWHSGKTFTFSMITSDLPCEKWAYTLTPMFLFFISYTLRLFLGFTLKRQLSTWITSKIITRCRKCRSVIFRPIIFSNNYCTPAREKPSLWPAWVSLDLNRTWSETFFEQKVCRSRPLQVILIWTTPSCILYHCMMLNSIIDTKRNYQRAHSAEMVDHKQSATKNLGGGHDSAWDHSGFQTFVLQRLWNRWERSRPSFLALRSSIAANIWFHFIALGLSIFYAITIQCNIYCLSLMGAERVLQARCLEP